MKSKLILLFVAALLAGQSCERVNVDELEFELGNDSVWADQSLARKFKFSVKGDFGNAEFSGSGTRATNMTADGSEMTDLWVLDVVGDEVVQMVHQTPSNDDWGNPSMSLALGTHHVIFLASRGQSPVYDGGVVKWSKPLDSFYTDYPVTVTRTSNGNRSVTLDRCATKLQLIVEDAMKTGTTAMLIEPSTWYNGWNMLTGEPVQADGYTASFNVPSSWWGVAGGSFSVWSLSGADEWTADVLIESKAGESVNAEVLIEGAPFVANRATVYRGSLYSASAGNALSLSTEWASSYEGRY